MATRDARLEPLLAALGTRPLVMGILNLTPDSFSDGGRFERLEAARAQAKKLVEGGADILDVGARIHAARPYAHSRSTRNGGGSSRRWGRSSTSSRCPSPSTLRRRRSRAGRWRSASASSTTSGDCSATRRWRRRWPAPGPRSSSCTIARPADPDIDIVEDMLALLRAFAETRRPRGRRARARSSSIPASASARPRPQDQQAIAATGRLKQTFGLPVLIGLSRKRVVRRIVGRGRRRSADRHARRQSRRARAWRGRVSRARRRRA